MIRLQFTVESAGRVERGLNRAHTDLAQDINKHFTALLWHFFLLSRSAALNIIAALASMCLRRERELRALHFLHDLRELFNFADFKNILRAVMRDAERCKWGANHKLCNSREPWRWICIMESDFPLLHCINVKIVARDRARLLSAGPSRWVIQSIDWRGRRSKQMSHERRSRSASNPSWHFNRSSGTMMFLSGGIPSRYQLLWRDYLRLSRFN